MHLYVYTCICMYICISSDLFFYSDNQPQHGAQNRKKQKDMQEQKQAGIHGYLFYRCALVGALHIQ